MKKIYFKYLTIVSLIIAIILIIFKSNFVVNYKEPEIVPVSNSVVLNKITYLTFDDGPSESTKKIINILDKYQIKATFFVVGPEYKFKNELLELLQKDNQAIAIHSYEHKYSNIYKDVKSYLNDFYLCSDWIKKITKTTPSLYRFPGGSSNTITNKGFIKEVIKELYGEGFEHVDWNIDSFDSHYNNDTKSIINTVVAQVKKNEQNGIYEQTILMHDNTKKVATIEALPTIIEYLIKKGYTFKPLTKNDTLAQHVKRSA